MTARPRSPLGRGRLGHRDVGGQARRASCDKKCPGQLSPRCPARESASSVVEVLPRRWVVERAFAWISKHRRTVRDYEHRPASHEAMILWAMIALMTRRLAQPTDLSDAHFRSGIPLRTLTHARSFTYFPDACVDVSHRDE